ncbi:SurA N-terminal domain-containing protein [Haloferula chungangensis]|uniref:SurA N-terminal domain-containing protein n=1 Tax=Haloferula chungangensis TaxID=1048331 RepID=A0ABW2L6X3_9BACT
MIENIRKYTGLIIVVIVVLVLGFIFMDTSGLFQQRAGGGADYIQIDGRNYSQGDFNRIGRNPLNLAQSLRSFDENGIQIMQFASTLMSGAQTEETAAQNFFACRMILKEAFDEFGVHPSQQEIEKFIMGLSTFQVRPAPGAPPGSTTGEFDQAAYNEFIDSFIGRLGLKESDLQALVRDVIATTKLREIIGDGLTVSRDLAETSTIVNTQQIEASVASIEIAPFRESIKPSDEELRTFWEEVKDGYMTEQRIKVSYFIAAPTYPEAAADEAAPEGEQTDEQKAAAADAKAEKEAKEIEAKAEADKQLAIEVDSFVNELTDADGANFDALIEASNWKLVATDWFTPSSVPDELKIQPRATSLGKSVADQLFALTTGPDALAPFSKAIAVGQDQWLFARLDALEEPRIQTFEEAKEEITKRYIDEKADEALKEHVEGKITAIKESMEAGKSFAEAAKEAGLTTTELGPFGPSDTLSDGYTAAELYTPASSVNPGEIAEPIYNEKQAIILSVIKRQIIKDDNRGQQIDATMERLAADNANRAFDAWLTQRLENAEVRDLTKG